MVLVEGRHENTGRLETQMVETHCYGGILSLFLGDFFFLLSLFEVSFVLLEFLDTLTGKYLRCCTSHSILREGLF